MKRFLTKAALYENVTRKIKESGFNISASSYRIDSISLAHEVCLELQIQNIDFEETKICGILFRGDKSTTIALNARRSHHGRNFDCMHELIHYWFHDEQSNFFCTQDDNRRLEWQANEGAAQFLMPYQNFIPNYHHHHQNFLKSFPPETATDALITHLSKSYGVGGLAVQYRINSLSHEIEQYINGTCINDIEVLSRRALLQQESK